MRKNTYTHIIIFMLITLTGASAIEFAVNAHRRNPYNRTKFRVKWDGKVIPGIVRISGLERNTQVVEYKSGNDAKGKGLTVPGKTTFVPLILERGRTHDNEFEKWAEAVWERDSSGPDQYYKKDIIIELMNEAGQIVIAFMVYDCWPVKYSPITGLDASSNEMAVESMVLSYSGWQRDQAVVEPTEPGFTEP